MHMVTVLLEREPDLEQICLQPASSMWILDLVQKRFHKTHPGDLDTEIFDQITREERERLYEEVA